MDEKAYVVLRALRQVASVFQETCCPGMVEEKEAWVHRWGVVLICP